MPATSRPTDHATDTPPIADDVDLDEPVFIGVQVYHACTNSIPGCPEHLQTVTRGTLEDAVEKNLGPCADCSPPDWRANGGASGA